MKKSILLKGALIGALIIFILPFTTSCQMLNKSTSDSDVTKSTDEKLEKLQELIDKNYIGDIEDGDLKDGIYKGFVEGLDDPYSVYYTEEETKALMEQTTGEYSGIGAVLSQDRDSGIITILQVYEDSPADEAGLKDGDYFLKVGDKELTSKDDLSEVVRLIKGEEGSKVDLTVYREKEKKEIEVTVTRRKIQARTVETKMLEDGIGYLAISEFDSVTLDQYKEGMKTLADQGMEKLVVDLRNNPGGNLDTVTDILDIMLPKGISVYMEDKSGARKDFETDEENKFDKPLVVLVNGNSASASEIYAGAIQDFKAGTVIGTTTYGKGVVQQIFDLNDGTSVKLTIAEYFTPNGRNINEIGITPDIECEYEENEENPEADNQLDKAIEYLKEK